MRYLIAAAALALLAIPAQADTMPNCAGMWHNMPADQKTKTTYAAHMKTCMASSYAVPKTEAVQKPAGATGQCMDGTYTTTKNHQGVCSGHGGVNKWF